MQLTSNDAWTRRRAIGGSGDAQSAGPSGLLQQVHQLQDTFTAVLAQFGRDGFASAAASSSVPANSSAAATDSAVESAEAGADDQQPMEEAITSSWNEWFDRRGVTAYRDTLAQDDGANLKQDYGQILLAAYRNGGYATPTAFLQTLDKEQLATIQTVHRLANPIDVHQLQDEGAANLLIPPPAQVDFDRDGLTQVGMARTIRFPDSSTPTEVRDAWEAATADLPPFQKMLYEFQMKVPALTANLRLDSSGGVRSVQPGEVDWVNPMASPSYSYREAVNQRLDYLDTFQNQIPPDQYQRDHSFWTKFGALLDQHQGA